MKSKSTNSKRQPVSHTVQPVVRPYPHCLYAEQPIALWDERLQCDWIRWTAIKPNALLLELPEMNCTDMDGAIKFAKSIMPDVAQIDVFSGDKMDCQYRRFGNRWQCDNDLEVYMPNPGRQPPAAERHV